MLTRLRAAGVQDGDADPATLELQADLVTAIGAALMQSVGVRAIEDGEQPTPQAPRQMIELLRPIWARLL